MTLQEDGVEGSPDMALEGRALAAVEAPARAGMDSYPALVAGAATGRADMDSRCPAFVEEAG
ncbi:hypothetical protein, partial [Mycobacterium celatum]|uniref:hypothetical protein n=1 Tax=Mycobacterium celatum TaxID=28045 RepID=UPI001E4E60A3